MQPNNTKQYMKKEKKRIFSLFKLQARRLWASLTISHQYSKCQAEENSPQIPALSLSLR